MAEGPAGQWRSRADWLLWRGCLSQAEQQYAHGCPTSSAGTETLSQHFSWQRAVRLAVLCHFLDGREFSAAAVVLVLMSPVDVADEEARAAGSGR